MGEYESYIRSVRGDEPTSVASTYLLRDGNEIPCVGYGTFQIEPGPPCVEAVLAALEAGYRHIDTARLYGNEKAVGEAIAKSGLPRDQIFVTSKVWNDKQREGRVLDSLEHSLEDLGLDYLDLFLIHWPEPGVFRRSWEVLQRLQSEGLITSIGVSNFRTSHLNELLSDGTAVPVVDQMEHNPMMQDLSTIATCAQLGIIYEAWAPLGEGAALKDPRLAGIAEEFGVSVAQVILRWNVQNRTLALPRSCDAQRVAENADVFGFELSPEQMAVIDGLNENKHLWPGVEPDDFSYLANVKSD